MLEMSGGKPEAGLPVWRLNQVLTIIQERMQNLPIEGRGHFPIVWSTMHMYGTTQLAKLVALKRNLNPELAALTCAFHDVHTLHTGDWEDHALKAEGYIREIVAEYNERWGNVLSRISDAETEQIISAIRVHVEKTVVTEDPYAELLKDVDSLDSFLNGFKPTDASGRIGRINRVLSEMSLDKRVP
jgi:uncharacterized protein